MSLSLRADDCNELPSMENWLNAGAEWSEHHGIIESTTSAPLFYHAETCNSTPISLFESLQKEAAVTHPFLKLDTLELCKENPDALLMRTGSSSMVESSGNEEDINSEQQGKSVTLCAIPSTALSASSLDEANLYTEADSPRGPLSPAALQLGKSPRTVSNKRTFDDTSEAASWVRKSPRQQDNHRAPVEYPPFVPIATAVAQPPLAIPTAVPFLPAAGNGGAPAAVAAPSILFSTPLSLPTVPSLEEIAQTRPKRRNVRISKDPQSVAARHRRERISDRVRVLQHFVPGGTKMDTASMLDEAINYVKFLQQQLQTLERIGNSYDARFMTQGGPMMMPHLGNSVRPFDLNCAVYQTYPSTSMAQPASQQPLQTWPNTRATSPFCSQGFSDSVQEQFCH
ncbi:hypothetical protein M758_6G028700 [Ceratodon purpureus]|uniref:BHLH domain-containing protein n=1 Tax=Ceratodon purpureus TaxID=3225 RepID=A0A8T0HEP1_CERPU|nr:hypothetical protein KC19_6G031600 [Ceratodon purpureus]KAG0612448.1 hypothetical protein M758_6G028700 [Ceratodon purpureus]